MRVEMQFEIKNFVTGIAAAAAVSVWGGFAAASTAIPTSTISFSGTSGPATVTCTAGGCQAFSGAGSFTLDGKGQVKITNGPSGTLGDTATGYDIGNANPATEAQALDFLINGIDDNEFVEADATKTNGSGVDSKTFTSSAEYIVFKLGGGTRSFFLKLLGDGPIELSFAKNGSTGGGLSHYTEFGERPSSPVPVPAAGFLLLTGLGGLGLMRRRRRAA